MTLRIILPVLAIIATATMASKCTVINNPPAAIVAPTIN